MKDLICLHAGTSGPSTWDRFIPRLQALGYRVHRPTLLGHGTAPRRGQYVLTDFRDHLLRELEGLDHLTLIGNSLGAYVASAVAVAEPGRVDRMVLEEIPVPPRDIEDRGPTLRSTPGPVLRAAGWLTHRRCDPRLLRDVITDLRRPQPDWWAGLAAVTAPTLILAGGHRSHLDQTRFTNLTNSMPNATITTIEAGHRIHSRRPERWLTEVETFFAFKET